MNVKCLIPCWKKYPPLSLLAAAIPTILSADGIWVCERVQISKQLEPFAFLFCWSFPQLLDPTCSSSSSSSSLCLHLTKVAKLSKCKEVAWKEALVGQRASPILLLFAQLKKRKYGKSDLFLSIKQPSSAFLTSPTKVSSCLKAASHSAVKPPGGW